MLVVTRKLNEVITISPIDEHSKATLADAFSGKDIEIKLLHASGRRVRLLIQAPPQLKIRRGADPEDRNSDDTQNPSTLSTNLISD